MNSIWIIVGAVLLIVIPVGIEVWQKRNKKRPLSHLAQGRRRYDDPNRPDQDKTHHVVSVNTIEGMRDSKRQKHWNVVKDPEEYAKAMMPKPKKGPKK